MTTLTKRTLLGASLYGLAASACPRRVRAAPAAPFMMFDGHLHLVADDQHAYPHAPGFGNPPAAPGGPGPGGVRNFAPGTVGAPRALTDAMRVVQWMDQQGVQAAAAVQKKGTYGFDNSYILDSAAKYPDRFKPVVVLDGEDSKTPGLIEAFVRKRGLAGVRLTGGMSPDFTFPWLSSPQVLQSWSVLNDHGLVADLMITAPSRPPQGIAELVGLATKYPSVRLVLDHVAYPMVTGGPEFGIDAIHQTLAACPNVYCKFTVINLDVLRQAGISGVDFVRRIVDVYGADHVLWGSDAGNSSGSYAEIVPRMVAATGRLTDAERRAVLHDTGASVFLRGGKA